MSNSANMDRRHFIKHVAGASALTLGGANLMSNLLAAPAPQLKNKHIVIMWMGGGPSHMDLWDVKTDSPNKGEFKPIDTAAPGVQISEVLPGVAKEMKDLSIIRSVSSQEGDHNRGTFKMTHGFSPSALGVLIPGLGAVAGYYLGSESVALPRVVTVGAGQAGDAGFLGASFAGFPVQNPGQVPENMRMPNMGNQDQSKMRAERRRLMLMEMEKNFAFDLTPDIKRGDDKARKNFSDAAQAHRELYAKAFDVSLKTGAQTFQFNQKDNEVLQRDFGNGGFGRAAMLASKLVENGVVAVQIGIGGWDMHNNIFNSIKTRQGPELDKGMSGLVKRLRDIGKLKDTVVVWMGDFGRTPRINQNGGRDHWARGWSVVVGGGGIKGGQVYGSTGQNGTDLTNPVSVNELYATMYTALGINLNDRNLDLHDNLGRRYYIAGDKGNAKPLAPLV